MDNIRFIKPADLHAEMLRLYREEQMDFLKCLSGMDWGEPADGDAPDAPRGLGVVYLLESTATGKKQQYVLLPWTARILNYPVSATFGKQRTSMNVKYMTSMVLSS